MVAAISAAREGAKVTIIEHQNKLGKKILSTGNGKCNLTNEYMAAECFRGEDLSIVDTVLKKFGYKETVSFFESLGVLTKSRQGYIYPISEQASAVLDVLVMELEKLSVDVVLNEHVTSVSQKKEQFTVVAGNKKYCADAVILATGGEAAMHWQSNLVIRFLRLSLHLYNFAGKAAILNRWRAFAQMRRYPCWSMEIVRLLTQESSSLQTTVFPAFLFFRSADLQQRR